jgi:hypothetical protein
VQTRLARAKEATYHSQPSKLVANVNDGVNVTVIGEDDKDPIDENFSKGVDTVNESTPIAEGKHVTCHCISS